MAGPALAARAIISWALRGTKQLSPFKSKYIKMQKGTGTKVKGVGELRPWMKGFAKGEKSWLAKGGIGTEGRKKFRYGYAQSYKHLRKHKKLYGAGVAGATVWDFLPGKDNPKA